MIRGLAVGALMVVGCRQQDVGQPMRMPLAPARPVHFELTVSPQQVTATMVLPANFSVHQMGNLVVARGPEPRMPRLQVQAPPGPLGEPVILWDDNCKLGDDVGALKWTVAERVPQQNGALFVCVDPNTKASVVVRHFSWEGHPIECSLAFGDFELAPSPARIAEAKELCNSVALRRSLE